MSFPCSIIKSNCSHSFFQIYCVFAEQELWQKDTGNNYSVFLVSGMRILKEVCFMTVSFPAIHLFCDSVIISQEHLKKSTCQGNCVYFTTRLATIHYNKRSVVDLRKCWRVCLFWGKPFWPCSFKGACLFHITSCNVFFGKYTPKSTYKGPILSWWASIVKLLSLFQKL